MLPYKGVYITSTSSDVDATSHMMDNATILAYLYLLNTVLLKFKILDTKMFLQRMFIQIWVIDEKSKCQRYYISVSCLNVLNYLY